MTFCCFLVGIFLKYLASPMEVVRGCKNDVVQASPMEALRGCKNDVVQSSPMDADRGCKNDVVHKIDGADT